MEYLKYFEGYLNEFLYKEISEEEAENFTRESVRKHIKDSITKDDYVKLHKIMYKMFEVYPISKINHETKEDFEIEAKVNAEYIYGNKEKGDPTASLLKTIVELLNDGRIYFSIKKSNPHNYPKLSYRFSDINLYKIEGDVWILNLFDFSSLKCYQLEGIEGLEDMIKNKEFNI
jgi:hypothetical protein